MTNRAETGVLKGFKRPFRRLLQSFSRRSNRRVGLWKCVERVTGIEPAWPAWKAGALPLSYTRETVGANPFARPRNAAGQDQRTLRSVMSVARPRSAPRRGVGPRTCPRGSNSPRPAGHSARSWCARLGGVGPVVSLEELDQVVVGVGQQDLASARSAHHLAAEGKARATEPVDLCIEVVDDEVDAIAA